MTSPTDIPFCCGDIRLTAENFETNIYYDPKEGVYYDGWRDSSPMQNHLLVRAGTVSHETRDGVEGCVFDGTLLASMRQYLMMGAGGHRNEDGE